MSLGLLNTVPGTITKKPFLKIERSAIPNGLPLSFRQVKTALRVDRDDEDGRIAGLIRTGEQAIEQIHNIVLQTQSFVGYLDSWPSQVDIRLWPTTAITSVKYYNSSDVLTTMPTSDYRVDLKSDPANIVFDEAPTLYDKPNPIEITFVCGFATLANVPPNLVEAINLYCMQRYDCPLDQQKPGVPTGFDALVGYHSKKTY